jgi:hypothetical protein
MKIKLEMTSRNYSSKISTLIEELRSKLCTLYFPTERELFLETARSTDFKVF